MRRFNVKPKQIVKIYDQLMQRESFYIIADFPDLNLTDCRIDVIIGFGIEQLNKLKLSWESRIGDIFPVDLEESGNRNFTLLPR